MSAITPERRVRINRLKKIIVVSNFTILFVALFGCIVLLIRVHGLSGRVEELEASLKEAEEKLAAGTVKDTDTDGQKETDADTDEKVPEETVNPETIYEKIAYLTFDDGPSENTMTILDVLDSYNVKGTFFVNGKEGSEYEERYREIVKRGNSIGLHSYTHEFSAVYESVESFAADTLRIHDYVYEVTGMDTKLYRFPGGSSTTRTDNIKTYIEYLEGEGYIYYDWNVSSGDASETEPLPVQTLVDNVMNGVGDRDRIIVLMHDSAVKDTTVEALPIIIERLTEEGYTILPIVETTTPVHHTVN